MAGFELGSIVARLKMDSTEFKKGITDAKQSVGDFQKNIGGVGTSLKSIATIAGVALGAAGLTKFLKDCVNSAAESEAAMAQTEAVIKSTGGAAGVTADQVAELAKQLQNETAFSDEAVQGAENLLLTFTNIKNDIFPQATKVVLDMSQALGQDLKSSSVQLGKALQNPIDGISALQRVGVQFTDSQKKVIESLVNTNRGAEAQKMILEELNREFGGSASAYATTYAGKIAQLKNKFDDLMEGIGGALIPVINYLIDSFGSLEGAGSALVWIFKVIASAINGVILVIQLLGNAIGSVVNAIVGLFTGGINGMKEHWSDSVDVMKDTWQKGADNINSIWSKASSKNVGIAQASDREMTKSNAEKGKQIAKQLADETRNFERETKKRLSAFNESLAQMVRDHLEAKKSLEKDIADETRDYNENMADREVDQKDTMDQMKSDHEDKVASIQEQIDAETAKGLDADATKLQSFIDEIAKEDVEYQAKVLKQEEKYKKENERLKRDHEEKLAAYQTQLDNENAILAKHAEDVAKFKDMVVEDDITRLKRQFAEEEALRAEDHARRLQEIYAQGVAESVAYEEGKKRNTGSSVGTNIKNTVTEAQKNVNDTIKSIAPITNIGVGSVAPSVDTGKGILETIGDSIKSAWGWLTSKLPKFDVGGVVGGALGSPQLIMAHAGETILPTHKGAVTIGTSGQKQTIINQYITNNVKDSTDVGTINERLAFILRNQNL